MLSPAQTKVYDLVLMGKPSKDIATELDCSVATIKFHLTEIFKQFGVRTRIELLAIADRSTLVPVAPTRPSNKLTVDLVDRLGMQLVNAATKQNQQLLADFLEDLIDSIEYELEETS